MIVALLLAATAPPTFAAPTAEAVLKSWDADPHHDLQGVIVLKDGRVVAERYYNGAEASTLHDVRSAGKSVTSLLMGIAIDQHRIRAVSDPVSRYWPEAAGSAIGSVQLDNVLTMRSGLAAYDADPASPGQEDRLDAATDPAAFILAVPQATTPGTLYRYNSVTASVAGIVIAKATGQTLERFAAAALFKPLGVTRWRWSADAAGFTKGQGNLSLTLREFANIGELVRCGGAFHGHRVVSSAWVRSALSPRVRIDDVDHYADAYGYFWYSRAQNTIRGPVSVSFASGNGGNKIYIVADRRMVVAITSSAYGHGYGQKRSEDILKAILASE